MCGKEKQLGVIAESHQPRNMISVTCVQLCSSPAIVPNNQGLNMLKRPATVFPFHHQIVVYLFMFAVSNRAQQKRSQLESMCTCVVRVALTCCEQETVEWCIENLVFDVLLYFVTIHCQSPFCLYRAQGHTCRRTNNCAT